MTSIPLEARHVEILLETLKNLLRLGSITPRELALAKVAVTAAENELISYRESFTPQGRELTFPPMDRAALFILRYDDDTWRYDPTGTAMALERAARAVLPKLALGGELNPFFASETGYFGRALDELRRHGFDVLKTSSAASLYGPDMVAETDAAPQSLSCAFARAAGE